MTESEWKNRINDILRADPAFGELRAEVERSCWRFLTRLRDSGVGAALKVTIDPISGNE